MPLSMSILRTHAREMLGSGVVNVEVTDAQIDQSVRLTVALLNRYLPAHRWAMLTSNTSGRYRLDNLGYPGFSDVVDVQEIKFDPSVPSSNNDIDVFDPMIYLPGTFASDGFIANYRLAIERLRTARRMFSNELEWRAFWEPNSITGAREYALYVSTGSTGRYRYGFQYLCYITPDDNAFTGVSWIDFGVESWVLQYVTACAKETLAAIRRKFQGIPGPDGSDLALDGSDLAADAQIEKDNLIAELKGMRSSLPPIVG